MKITLFIALGFMVLFILRNKFRKVDFTVDAIEGIQFHKGTWKEVLTLARSENKPIFLDIYAPWCGPCKMLKTTTFADKELGAFMNNEFVNVALDGEHGEGLELLQKYGIRSFPTLLILNSEGIVLSKTAGYKSAKELMNYSKNTINFQKNEFSKN